MNKYTFLKGAAHSGTTYGLYWAQRCTRWDVYPQQPLTELVQYTWEGFFCPQPDGTWYKSPVSYVLTGTAYAPSLQGEWRSEDGSRLVKYVRVDGAS